MMYAHFATINRADSLYRLLNKGEILGIIWVDSKLAKEFVRLGIPKELLRKHFLTMQKLHTQPFKGLSPGKLNKAPHP